LGINVIISVLFISLFIGVFFFTYGAYIEGQVVKNQMNFLSADVAEYVNLLGGDVNAYIKTQLHNVPKIDLDEEDNKVKKNNTQVLIKAVVANAVFIVITIGIVYYLNKTANLNLMEVLLKNFIILIFIALTEFAFLTFYGAHLISIDPNKVKFYMVESVKNILLSLKNENK